MEENPTSHIETQEGNVSLMFRIIIDPFSSDVMFCLVCIDRGTHEELLYALNIIQ